MKRVPSVEVKVSGGGRWQKPPSSSSAGRGEVGQGVGRVVVGETEHRHNAVGMVGMVAQAGVRLMLTE